MIRKAAVLTLIAAFVSATTPGFACTGISLKAQDGAAIRGRTLEFGFPMQSNVLVIPAGKEMSGTLPDGGKGLVYTSRYAIVGANALGFPAILDGLNDQGLIGPVALAAVGSGSGLHGMPGDFTPPSRFVRAAIYSQSAAPNATAEDAVFSAFHILNQFDIPKGSVQNSAIGGTVAEITEWTSVADLKNLRWYFRTFTDQSIHMVALK